MTPAPAGSNAAAVARALDILAHRRGNLFLTGRAGTGKTTFLNRAREEMEAAGRNVAVVAFSGMAAVQARGQTIHSLFKLPFKALHPRGPELNERFRANFVYKADRKELFRQLDLLFVDEVSMVRADMLDAIDRILRQVREREREPFGGVQVCLIGDAFQLPPVVADREEDALLADAYGASAAFFAAEAFDRDRWLAVELPEVMRQREGTAFVEILNRIRVGEHTRNDLAALNERVPPDFAVGFLEDGEAMPLLTAVKTGVEERNAAALAQLETPLYRFDATVEGEFPPSNDPAPRRLELRVGALVMFVRNDADPSRRYVNGTLGIVRSLSEAVVSVTTYSGVIVSLKRGTWEKVDFHYDQREWRLRGKAVGTFRQFPLRLAYAMTIHKSQGLTLDAARVDASAAFTAGQTYVALSRVRSFEGLVLEAPIREQDVRVSPSAVAFQRWVDASSGGASAKPTEGQVGLPPKRQPRFPPPPRPTLREGGAPQAVPHATDLGRARTRAELEAELEAMRRQRDQLLRVVRKMQRVMAGVDSEVEG